MHIPNKYCALCSYIPELLYNVKRCRKLGSAHKIIQHS